MGRSLKDALLGQMALLEERGLAPSEVPQEEESAIVVVESGSRGGRATRTRREVTERYGEEDLGLDDGREKRRLPRRDHRGEDAADRGARRGARPGRPHRRAGEEPGELLPPPPLLTPLDRGMRPGARPFSPGGPRPFRPGLGSPRPGAPRPPGRSEMLQQRAEQRRRDEDDIAEMRQLLAEYGGQEVDEPAMETFSQALAEETGALPPPRIVVAAIKHAKTADPRRIGDAIRAYYRRARSSRPPSGASNGTVGSGPARPQRNGTPSTDAGESAQTSDQPEPIEVDQAAEKPEPIAAGV